MKSIATLLLIGSLWLAMPAFAEEFIEVSLDGELFRVPISIVAQDYTAKRVEKEFPRAICNRADTVYSEKECVRNRNEFFLGIFHQALQRPSLLSDHVKTMSRAKLRKYAIPDGWVVPH